MKVFRKIKLFFTVTLFVSQFALAQTQETPPQLKQEPDSNGCKNVVVNKEITVESIQMGVLENQDNNLFTATQNIPLVEKTAYGWRMQLNVKNRKINWREVYSIPSPPKSWGIADSTNYIKVHSNRMQSESKQSTFTSHGVVDNYWVVLPGDPVGDQSMQVFVEGVFVCQLNFVVS
jgi:hypothetical protein